MGTRPSEGSDRSSASAGMSLVEVLVGLFIVAMTALAVAPLFALATKNNATGRDHGLIVGMAEEKMEDLFALPYGALVAGGSVDANVVDFNETNDEGFVIRWRLDSNTTPENTMILTVRVIAPAPADGGPTTETTLVSMRAR